MVNVQEVNRYFKNKSRGWVSASGSVENYLKQKGRPGMKSEFAGDPNFHVVCKYLEQVGELQLKSDVAKSLEEIVSGVFGFPLVGSLDILIGAAVEACGYKPLGDQIIESALTAGIVVLIGLLIGVVFSN